jgi:CRISPR-associated protein Csb3
MGSARFPLELHSPGQVLACLGLMEASELLCGPTQAGFFWRDQEHPHFELLSKDSDNPLESVLEFLSSAQLSQVAHRGFSFKKEKDKDGDGDEARARDLVCSGDCFPSSKGEDTALPIELRAGDLTVQLSHWADGSGRDTFKGYAGNRSAYSIARSMLFGQEAKPSKGKAKGEVLVKGIRHLWAENREGLLRDPLSVVTPMKGSFNFDPRGAWTALDAGYSPNEQKHLLLASPLVELLAAWGLEHNRMIEDPKRKRFYSYTVWEGLLEPILARVAFNGAIPTLTGRCFQFEFTLSGKNKIVNYAEEM